MIGCGYCSVEKGYDRRRSIQFGDGQIFTQERGRCSLRIHCAFESTEQTKEVNMRARLQWHLRSKLRNAGQELVTVTPPHEAGVRLSQTKRKSTPQHNKFNGIMSQIHESNAGKELDPVINYRGHEKQ
ncbi:hypothetical protein TNCV_2356801 [Trichonephila clavipes]|nr:hypothetical protein TNCV_2356801 [Trichonephila clavipes]